MQTNLNNARIHRGRLFATKRPNVTSTLTGLFAIPSDGPEFYMFDPGSSVKSVRLPSLSEEFSVMIANIGATNNLEVYNISNVLQTIIRPGELRYFFSGTTRWVWIPANFGAASSDLTGFSDELRIVTAAGAQVVSSGEAGLVLNKGVASATPVTLPLSASRLGKPIRFADWAGTTSAANPMTLTPSGAEKINNQATYVSETLGFNGLILFPNTTLGGYTLGG